MITDMLIKDVSSYPNSGVKIEELKKVNYFFGNNGSGKSTIAKYLYDLSLNGASEIDFSKCSQNGYDGVNNQILVFNEKFIDRNFIARDTQIGIFSLNQRNEEIDSQIELMQNELINYENRIVKFQNKKQKLLKDKESKYKKLKTDCFEQRKSILNSFLVIKDTFPKKQVQNHYDELINISLSNDTSNLTFENLVNSYKEYYDSTLIKIESQININLFDSVIDVEDESREILQKIIVGNDAVDIAKMIDDLKIKKWVEDGIQNLTKNKSLQRCPFCQKETIDEELIKKFEEYFDETYKNNINEIKSVEKRYTDSINLLIQNLDSILSEFNNENKVSNLIIQIKDILQKNTIIFEEKIEKSNERRELISIFEFKEIIEEINIIIENNNNNFENLDTHKKDFFNDIWMYLKHESNNYIQKYNNSEMKYNNASVKLENKISNLKEEIVNFKNNIVELREQTVSTKDAVDNINIILKNSGFEGFIIEEKELNDNNISEYYLKRTDNNNENVFKSLSEGEKNFIAFLYFYQLCLGVNNLDEASKKKILVIDDPVSSLDSQVLFIVNSLIQHLIARKGKSKPEKKQFKSNDLEQVFIFTHNIYFHKEVSLDNQRTCIDNTFFTIKKENNKSTVLINDKPILNDYLLLWDTLSKIKKNVDDNPGDKVHNISIANIMRRILESYVNFTGLGASVWMAVKDSNPEDVVNIICSSLISELQDGSHKVSPLDEMYFTRIANEESQKLFDVFKMIFLEIGEEHYNSMMGIEVE